MRIDLAQLPDGSDVRMATLYSPLPGTPSLGSVPLSNDLIVEVALDPAVQDLQLLIFDLDQSLGKMFFRGEM